MKVYDHESCQRDLCPKNLKMRWTKLKPEAFYFVDPVSLRL
jgi:hypothetical protein